MATLKLAATGRFLTSCEGAISKQAEPSPKLAPVVICVFEKGECALLLSVVQKEVVARNDNIVTPKQAGFVPSKSFFHDTWITGGKDGIEIEIEEPTMRRATTRAPQIGWTSMLQ